MASPSSALTIWCGIAKQTRTLKSPRTNYVSQRNVVLSVEAQPAQARRTTVWQGTLPPKFNPNSETTIITVNGQKLLPF